MGKGTSTLKDSRLLNNSARQSCQLQERQSLGRDFSGIQCYRAAIFSTEADLGILEITAILGDQYLLILNSFTF